MRRFLLSLFLSVLFAGFTHVAPVHAQDISADRDTYYRARVEKILEQGEQKTNEISTPYQRVEVTIQDGKLKGRTVVIDHGSIFSIDKQRLVSKGQMVVVAFTTGQQGTRLFQIVDTYRLNILLPYLGIFILAVILLSGWRGVGSILGMIISLGIISLFIVPQILNGADPLTISIAGCVIIMISTIYLAHGFSKQTTIALISTFLTLLFTGIISMIMVKAARLSGLGSEDAYSLKLGAQGIINFKGLFLGGILIGALGVLDDVTTGLTASIFELSYANPNMSFHKLIQAGLRVGREHIASLVNTLVLAYAGASLPIFITLIINPNSYPLWSILNSEMIIEEIVRTLSGSFGLVLAVPLTTVLAAWFVTRKNTTHRS